MKNIIASFTAKPGKGEALENILRDMVRNTALEPGAMVYELLRDESQPERIVVYERYRDGEAKASHLATPYLAQALEQGAPLMAEGPSLMHLETLACIRHTQAPFERGEVEVVVMPIGPVNLVYAKAQHGILACGAIDPAALEKFGIAAARVKPTRGNSIGNFDDLVAGEVREANATAQKLGIVVGMPGRDALKKLQG